jgi:uncharacterized protein YndB with AHSA1/START domain
MEMKIELPSDREFLAVFDLDAPRELVFRAHTDPELIPLWWGLRKWSTAVEKMELKPGGDWRFVQNDAEGKEHGFHGSFREIVPPEAIVWTFEYEGMPGHASLERIRFEEQGRGTRVTIQVLYDSAQDRDGMLDAGMIQGMSERFDRMEETLAEMIAGEEFVITRVLDAPRKFVFRSWTEAQHLSRWFGPKGTTITAARMDLRPKGVFHYCMQTPDGREMWGKWVFRDIAEPERIVLVNSFSDSEGGLTRHPLSPTWPLQMLSTTVFRDQGGKTKLSVRWVPIHATQEELETFRGAFDGMQAGWTGTLDQLEAFILSEMKLQVL